MFNNFIKTYSALSTTHGIFPDLKLTEKYLKNHLKGIEKKVHQCILYSTTIGSETGKTIDDYTTQHAMVNNMRNATDESFKIVLQQQYSFDTTELQSIKNQLLVMGIKIYKAGNSREYALLTYKHLLENPLINRLIELGDLKIEIQGVFARNSISTSPPIHLVIKFYYDNSSFFWDVQHQSFYDHANDLKYPVRESRTNYLRNINYTNFKLSTITPEFILTPISNDNAQKSIAAQKAIIQQKRSQLLLDEDTRCSICCSCC